MFSFLSLPKPALRPQARSASPSPLCVPKPALRPQARSASLMPPVFSQALLLSLLIVISLSLLAARPAQAQYLGEQFPGGYLSATPCDANGVALDPHPYPDYDGFYTMSGTQNLTITHTYPNEMVNAGLAAWPNGYQAAWLEPVYPIQMTAPNASPQPDPTRIYHGLGYYAGIDSPHEVDAGNSIGYYGSWWYSLYNNGTSHIGLANGSVTVDVTGHLVSYFKVTWYPSASTDPAPMPDHMNLRVKTNLMAEASIDPGTSLQNNGLWAQATASDGLLLGETASASAGLDATGLIVGAEGPSRVIGYHLVRAAVDPVTHMVTVFLDGTLHYVANDSVPYGILPGSSNPYGQVTNGLTSAHAASGISAGVLTDNREVTISADVDPTWHKEPLVDANGAPMLDGDGNLRYYPKQNVRFPDGSMMGDIGQVDTPEHGSGASSDYTAYVTYKANRMTDTSWAIYESQADWTASLTGRDPVSETLNHIYGLEITDFVVGYDRPYPPHITAYAFDGTPIYSERKLGVTGTDHIELTYKNGTYYVPGYPGSDATGNPSTDDASATALYTMTVHAEYENPFNYKADHLHKEEVQVHLDTPARSGVDQTFTYESRGAIVSQDLLGQGTLSLLLLTAPEWVSKVFEMTELTADKLLPEPEGGITSFDATWSHPGSTWVDAAGNMTTTPPPVSEYGFYKMQPAVSEEFVTKYVRQDHYVPPGDASGYTGYAGQKDSQTDARTGWEQGIGHYVHVTEGGD